MNERIKAIRKHLKLSQAEFAQRIGIKNTSISKLETGENNPSKQTILTICREFKVREDWLRTGIGEMFVEDNNTLIAALANEYNLDNVDQLILSTYIKLPDNTRAAFREFFLSFAHSMETGEQKNAEAALSAPTLIDNEKALEREADEFAAKAREQFLREKKQGSRMSFAKKYGTV